MVEGERIMADQGRVPSDGLFQSDPHSIEIGIITKQI